MGQCFPARMFVREIVEIEFGRSRPQGFIYPTYFSQLSQVVISNHALANKTHPLDSLVESSYLFEDSCHRVCVCRRQLQNAP